MSERERMSYEQLRDGLSQGRTLIQEEWANPSEIADTDKLIKEGYATADAWRYKDNYQCEMRKIYGIKQ